MVFDVHRGAERRYVALGDVVGSREIEEREVFRSRFEEARVAITDAYEADLLAGPTPSRESTSSGPC